LKAVFSASLTRKSSRQLFFSGNGFGGLPRFFMPRLYTQKVSDASGIFLTSAFCVYNKEHGPVECRKAKGGYLSGLTDHVWTLDELIGLLH